MTNSSAETMTCTKCGHTGPDEDFPKRARIKRHKHCKQCNAEYHYHWRHDHVAEILLVNAKRRAKKLGLEFDITVDDIVVPDVCPVLGLTLRNEAPPHQTVTQSNANNLRKTRAGTSTTMVKPDGLAPSIDRLDNSKGYVRGNILVMSARANTLKRDGTLDEFEKLVQFLRGLPAPAVGSPS